MLPSFISLIAPSSGASTATMSEKAMAGAGAGAGFAAALDPFTPAVDATVSPPAMAAVRVLPATLLATATPGAWPSALTEQPLAATLPTPTPTIPALLPVASTVEPIGAPVVPGVGFNDDVTDAPGVAEAIAPPAAATDAGAPDLPTVTSVVAHPTTPMAAASHEAPPADASPLSATPPVVVRPAPAASRESVDAATGRTPRGSARGQAVESAEPDVGPNAPIAAVIVPQPQPFTPIATPLPGRPGIGPQPQPDTLTATTVPGRPAIAPQPQPEALTATPTSGQPAIAPQLQPDLLDPAATTDRAIAGAAVEDDAAGDAPVAGTAARFDDDRAGPGPAVGVASAMPAATTPDAMPPAPPSVMPVPDASVAARSVASTQVQGAATGARSAPPPATATRSRHDTVISDGKPIGSAFATKLAAAIADPAVDVPPRGETTPATPVSSDATAATTAATAPIEAGVRANADPVVAPAAGPAIHASPDATAPAPLGAPPVRAPEPAAVVRAEPGQVGHETGVAIARHVLADGGSTMTIRLDPHEFGQVEVRLAFDDHGTLRAVVAAEHPASLDLIRREAADLGRALTDAGVRADATSLRFDTRGDGSHGNGNGNGQPWQRQPQQRYPASAGLPDQRDDPATPDWRPMTTRGRVNLMA